MTILASELKIFASERMTDLRNGGGYCTANEVLDNVDNNVFPDIGSGDCVSGRTWVRGLYAGVRSPNTESLIASRVYLASLPSDTETTDVIFQSPVYAASRDEATESIYYTAQESSNSNLRLNGDHGVGATRLNFYYLTPQDNAVTAYPYKVGDVILLKEGANTHCAKIVGIPITWLNLSGPPVVSRLTYDISPPLSFDCHGEYRIDNTTEDKAYTTPCQLYLTRNLQSTLCGISPLKTGVSAGAALIEVESITAKVAPYNYVLVDATAPALGYQDSLKVVSTQSGVSEISPARTFSVSIPGAFALKRVEYVNAEHINRADEDILCDISATDAVTFTFPKDFYFDSPINWYYTGTYTSTVTIYQCLGEVHPGSVGLTALRTSDHALMTATDNGSGVLTGDATGTVDYASGHILATWTDPVNIADSTCTYKYQEQFTEADPDIVGLQLARCPKKMDGLIFRVNDDVVIHHTASEALANPVVASTTYPLSRSNVSRIWLEDATGTQIPTAHYTVNLSAGSVTMAAVLDLSAYQQPLTAFNTLADEAMIIQIVGNQLSLNQALQHAYAADVSWVSSLIRMSDLFASVTVPFSQQAWTSVWSDSIIGTPITPQFDAVTYPITMSNQGAITERWRVQFTSTTLVNVIGERVGQIATSVSITGVIAPVNPHTGAPYFSIPIAGWGAGWVNGNLLRFNTESADGNFFVARCKQPSLSPPPGTPDRVRLVFTGDVNYDD